jgi:DNA uptake protein ComE-like DNA-binding protein
MVKRFFNIGFILSVTLALALATTGCTWPNENSSRADQEDQQQRDEKMRDEAAKATERLKPEIQSAGRQLSEAAEKAAEEAHAAVQGAKEGWARGSQAPLDLNRASEKELLELPGISAPEARKIIRSRPYHNKQDLIKRGVIPRSTYDKIQDQVEAN